MTLAFKDSFFKTFRFLPTSTVLRFVIGLVVTGEVAKRLPSSTKDVGIFPLGPDILELELTLYPRDSLGKKRTALN